MIAPGSWKRPAEAKTIHRPEAEPASKADLARQCKPPPPAGSHRLLSRKVAEHNFAPRHKLIKLQNRVEISIQLPRHGFMLRFPPPLFYNVAIAFIDKLGLLNSQPVATLSLVPVAKQHTFEGTSKILVCHVLQANQVKNTGFDVLPSNPEGLTNFCGEPKGLCKGQSLWPTLPRQLIPARVLLWLEECVEVPEGAFHPPGKATTHFFTDLNTGHPHIRLNTTLRDSHALGVL